MEAEKQTETEQLYEKMTDKAEEQTQEPEETEQADEQAEETQEQNEEILSEEQLEIQRDIEAYQSKIEQLDAKLAAHEAQHIDAMKRAEMRKMNYSEEQIERYLPHAEGGTADEIKASVLKLSLEIPPKDNYGDPSLLNGKKQKPKTADPGEIGKKAYERVKHKIFPWMRGQ